VVKQNCNLAQLVKVENRLFVLPSSVVLCTAAIEESMDYLQALQKAMKNKLIFSKPYSFNSDIHLHSKS